GSARRVWPRRGGALPFLRYPPRLALEWDDFCSLASASPQRLFQARGVAMLSQKIVERFVSEFLKGLHAFRSKQSELLPGLFVKLDAFANHGVDPGSQRTRRLCGLVCIEINIFGTLVVFFQRTLKVLTMCRLSGSPTIPAFCSMLV